ncbi:MAG: hypothetical protein AAF399_24115 [Bacteroidota bacterium]
MNMLALLPILLYAYLGIGVIFSVMFVFWGVQKVDEGMASAKIGLRLLMMPGTIALWPVLLGKWVKANKSAAQ